MNVFFLKKIKHATKKKWLRIKRIMQIMGTESSEVENSCFWNALWDSVTFRVFRTWTKVTKNMWFGGKAEHKESWLGQCLLCESWSQRLRTIFSSNELRIIAGCYNRSHFQVSLRVSFLRDTRKCAECDQLQPQKALITISVLDVKCVPSWDSQSTRRIMGKSRVAHKVQYACWIEKPWVRCQVTWADNKTA